MQVYWSTVHSRNFAQHFGGPQIVDEKSWKKSDMDILIPVLKSVCLIKFLVPELSKMRILVVHDCIWSTGLVENVHAMNVLLSCV